MPDDVEAELGFRVANPNAPPDEPTKFEPINPEFQAKADKILLEAAEKWRREGK